MKNAIRRRASFDRLTELPDERSDGQLRETDIVDLDDDGPFGELPLLVVEGHSFQEIIDRCGSHRAARQGPKVAVVRQARELAWRVVDL